MRCLPCGFAATLLLPLLASAGETERIELGRRLFMDPTVSRTGKVACSSCHQPEHGFSDARATPKDEDGTGRRHPLPVLDLTAEGPLNWDGEFRTIDELLWARLGAASGADKRTRELRMRRVEEAKAAGRNPDEGAFVHEFPCFPSRDTSILFMAPAHRLRIDGRYDDAFRVALGAGGISASRIVEAIRAYVLSLRSEENAYDRHSKGDPDALTPPQRRGLALFAGKAGCAACHVTDAPEGGRARFTDGAFHDVGIAYRSLRITFDGRTIADAGAGQITFVAEDLGRFRTPSLRDVARRGPYMHDGSLGTLEDVVRYYDRGGLPHASLDPRIRPLGLSDEEVRDLVAFLEALTSDRRPGIGPAREKRLDLRVIDLSGKPLAGFQVEVQPAGDRLEGGAPDDAPQVLVTDDNGHIAFDFPGWTHVRLASRTHEIQFDWLIPDCAPTMDVIAAPRDRIALWYRSKEPLPDVLLPTLPVGGALQRFRLVRGLDARTGIYATEANWAPLTGGGTSARATAVTRPDLLSDRRVSVFFGDVPFDGGGRGSRVVARTFELDLSGGWTDPIDTGG